ncbi:MAG: hypothetical protein IPI77_01355 [Saprospiraceae bacterium]|nr:hypothetical protein [Saprospiraceae bacterium]
MDNDQLRQKFLEEIAKSEQVILENSEMTKPVAPDVAIGRISRMDAINNKSVTEAVLRQAERKLISLTQSMHWHGPKVGSRLWCCESRPEVS